MIFHCEQDTKKIAAAFAGTLRGGELVFLYGDLGSGKTTFVRRVMEAFGFQEPVRSPTFTLVNRYSVASGAIRQVVHADLYRLNSPQDLLALALEEDVVRKDTVLFVEWPQHAGGLLAPATHEITFAGDGISRRITILPQPLAEPHQRSSDPLAP